MRAAPADLGTRTKQAIGSNEAARLRRVLAGSLCHVQICVLYIYICVYVCVCIYTYPSA